MSSFKVHGYSASVLPTYATLDTTTMRNISTIFQVVPIALLFASCTKDAAKQQQVPVADFSYSASGKAFYRVDFAVISPSATAKYFWHFGNGSTLYDTAGAVTHYYVTDDHQAYNVSVAKSNSNDTLTKSISLTEIGTFLPQLSTPLSFKYTVTASPPYNVIFSNNSANAVNYTWHFGDNATITSNAATIGHSYSQSGVYHVQLVATSANGISDTATATLTLIL